MALPPNCGSSHRALAAGDFDLEQLLKEKSARNNYEARMKAKRAELEILIKRNEV